MCVFKILIKRNEVTLYLRFLLFYSPIRWELEKYILSIRRQLLQNVFLANIKWCFQLNLLTSKIRQYVPMQAREWRQRDALLIFLHSKQQTQIVTVWPICQRIKRKESWVQLSVSLRVLLDRSIKNIYGHWEQSRR